MTPDDPLDSALQRESDRFLPEARPPFDALVSRQHKARGVRRAGAGLLAVSAVAAAAFVATAVREHPPRPTVVVAGPGSSESPTPSGPPSITDPSTWPLPVSDDDCPTGSSAAIRFADFVLVGERMYTGSRSTTTADLGRIILRTRCEYSRGAPDGGYRQQSGDAAYLPVGTEVHEVIGFDPRFRVAARVDGRVRVFQAGPPGEPGTAADLLPGVGPHVVSLDVSTGNGRVVARIADRARVEELVRLLLASPYSPDAGFAYGGHRLGLRLDDGTSTGFGYDVDTGQIVVGVQVPATFRDALREAVRTSEGQPLPRCILVPGNYQGDRDAEDYIGLAESEARRRAAAAGLELRVLGRDGTCTGERTANSATRVNVDVRDGVVRDAARF